MATVMDALVDVTEYPTREARASNEKMRPLGMGVSGLWDTFATLGLVWGEDDAVAMDKAIFKTMYHAALTASSELAAEFGAYEYHLNSPADRDRLQPDLWGETSARDTENITLPKATPIELDWSKLRCSIATYGLRNSQSIAIMPTASTAQIVGNSESIEAPSALICVRRTLSGDHVVFNKVFREMLIRKKMLTEETLQSIVAHKGSAQTLDGLTAREKLIFRNAWEIPQKVIVEHARARSPYICQSQSLNIHLPEVTEQKLTNLHFATWGSGMKISNYYIRTRDPAEPVNFSIAGKAAADIEKICKIGGEDTGGCASCSA
tara:strand:+ start:19797 stop:20759 length:963 start_codon:yes stop_codon:yes gene_type:complete